jgi:hypothetical protein
MKFEKVVFPTILLVLLGTSVWIFLSSRWGVGVIHDSIFYLSSAGNLVNHNGRQWSASDGSLHPLTHFPPLYSLLIASIMLFHVRRRIAWKLLGHKELYAGTMPMACCNSSKCHSLLENGPQIHLLPLLKCLSHPMASSEM